MGLEEDGRGAGDVVAVERVCEHAVGAARLHRGRPTTECTNDIKLIDFHSTNMTTIKLLQM